MNRAERRKLQNKITGNMSREAAQKALMEASTMAYKEAVRDTAQKQILVMSVCLRDKFGWNGEQLNRLLDEMEELSDTVNQKRVKVSDLHQIVIEELGIDIVKIGEMVDE